MEATLTSLVKLLAESIPTIIFFIFLIFYLQRVLFRPLSRILEERHRQTEGVRELAERARQEAQNKNDEYERALQQARAEIYRQHDAMRRHWAAEQEQELAAARAEAERTIEQAKVAIEAETRRAENELQTQVQALSEQITDALLRRRAA